MASGFEREDFEKYNEAEDKTETGLTRPSTLHRVTLGLPSLTSWSVVPQLHLNHTVFVGQINHFYSINAFTVFISIPPTPVMTSVFLTLEEVVRLSYLAISVTTDREGIC